MIVENDCLILHIFQMSDGETREEVPMDVMIHQQAEREAQRVQANREELVERIARAMREDGTAQPLSGLHLSRRSLPLERVHSVVEPSVCVIAQGSKEVLLGESRYRYDPSQYLLTTIELPRVSQVLEASKERPYLSLRLELAPTLVSSVLVEAGHASPPGSADVRAIAVSPLDGNLLDAFVRLVKLLQDFDQPLRIEQIARELGMSVSGFHHHFKAVTAMSPLQFQKQLRLQEARRLMLGKDLDAASAAYRVGYHDASHFNREYKNLFGVPPMRDVQRLREEAQESGGR
jgi:AraC-like DNA-binding protein